MTFDDVVAEVRGWLGREISIAITLTDPGPGTGWLADNSGRLARIDEPIAGVDDDVHYVRFEDGPGFALPRDLFRGAEWQTYAAAEPNLVISLGAVELSISPPA